MKTVSARRNSEPWMGSNVPSETLEQTEDYDENRSAILDVTRINVAVVVELEGLMSVVGRGDLFRCHVEGQCGCEL